MAIIVWNIMFSIQHDAFAPFYVYVKDQLDVCYLCLRRTDFFKHSTPAWYELGRQLILSPSTLALRVNLKCTSPPLHANYRNPRRVGVSARMPFQDYGDPNVYRRLKTGSVELCRE